jgi:hypothetical protein
VITCYVDESGTDSNSPIAVVGGLLLDCSGCGWLPLEWHRILDRHGIPSPIHMREFAPNQRFGSVTHDVRRKLFAELAWVINDNKIASIGATLASDIYCQIFQGVSRVSMYGASFAMLVMMNDAFGPVSGYTGPISYVLDAGNNYASHIREAYIAFNTGRSLTCGEPEFLEDHTVCALQAADVISWSIRRRLTGTGFKHGFEPLSDLFDVHHRDIEYTEEWMQGVADKIRASASVDDSGHNSEIPTKPQD